MFVKQANGKVFGAQFTKKEQQAIDIEVRKLVADQNDVYNRDLDAVLLFVLRQEFGFGKKRLEQFLMQPSRYLKHIMHNINQKVHRCLSIANQNYLK